MISKNYQSKPGFNDDFDIPLGSKKDLDINIIFKDFDLPVASNYVKGTRQNDHLIGTKKSDFIDGKKGNDTLLGSKGNDLIFGAKGNDTLFGSRGNDYLDGSKGSDILIGGKGADVFQFSKGFDIVRDFSLKQGDRIGLKNNLNYSIVDTSNGIQIKLSENKKMYLDNVDYNDFISAGDDLFVNTSI